MEEKSILEKICLFILHWGTYLILLTPLVIVPDFFFLFVGPKTLYFYGLTEIIFAAWLFLNLLTKKYRPRSNLLLVALSVFLFVSILSALLGEDPSKSFWSTFERLTGLLTLFHLFAFLLAASSVFQEKRDWLSIFGISVGVGSVVSLLAVLPKIGLPDILSGFPAQEGATLGNTSFLATYLLLQGFLALYLIFKSTGRLKTFSAMAFALILFGLVSSTGYAAIISFFIGLLLAFLFWLIFCRGPFWQIIGVSLLGIFLLAGISSLFLILQPQTALHQFVIQKFSQSRLIMAEISLMAWRQKPLLGWGPENFDLAFYRYFHSCLFLPICSPNGAVLYDKAHNILFDTLVAAGGLGLLSYLSLFAAAFYLLWKRYCQEKSEFWTSSIFLALLFAYLLQNLTVFDMVSSYLLFFLILGFITSQTSRTLKLDSIFLLGSIRRNLLPKFRRSSKFWQDLYFEFREKNIVVRLRQMLGRSFGAFQSFGLIQQKKLFLCLLIFVFFCLSFFEFVLQPARAGFSAIKALDAVQTEQRIALYKKTFGFTRLGQYQLREFFADNLMGKQIQDGLRPEMDFLASELEKTLKDCPLCFRSYLKLGQFYNFYGRLEPDKFKQAENILEKAVSISPMHQEAYWTLSETKLSLAKKDEAIFLLEKALALEPRLQTSRSRLEQVRGY